jgi:hypothetical protein
LGENPAHTLVSDHEKILRFSPTGPQSNKQITKIRHSGEKIRQIANIEMEVVAMQPPGIGASARSWIGVTRLGGRYNTPEGMTGVRALGEQTASPSRRVLALDLPKDGTRGL